MTKIIAEVGLNHMGSLKLAKKYIVEIAKTGVWGIKFQIHDPYFESSRDEKFRVKVSNKYKNRYDYWKKTSFSENEWKKLYLLSKKNNLKFIVSPFSVHSLKVIENICLPGWIKNDVNVKKKAKKLLRYFGLQDFANKKPLTLSGGEKQRVAIARSLINNPKIIFADEPTGNLDSKNSKILFDLFFKLRDDYNCSVVIVTHDENSANKCDRKLLIVDGKIKN